MLRRTRATQKQELKNELLDQKRQAQARSVFTIINTLLLLTIEDRLSLPWVVKVLHTFLKVAEAAYVVFERQCGFRRVGRIESAVFVPGPWYQSMPRAGAKIFVAEHAVGVSSEVANADNEPHLPSVHVALGDEKFGEVEKYPIKPIAETGTPEVNDAGGVGSTTQLFGVVGTVPVVPQVCVDQWPALFANGKIDIQFDNGDVWSFSNEIKGWIEDFIGAPINWWPLSARRKPLLDGSSRVRWKCVSGTFFKMQMSH
jgi:hypothetical protein